MHDEKRVATFEMADLARNLNLIQTLVGFGTLWLVPEDVWKQLMDVVPYDMNSTRECHPGCSVLPGSARQPVVPMLHGTSKARKKFAIRVTGIIKPDAVTWFGAIPPRQVPFAFWRRPSASGRRIVPAPGKSFLSAEEGAAIRDLTLKMTGYWSGGIEA